MEGEGEGASAGAAGAGRKVQKLVIRVPKKPRAAAPPSTPPAPAPAAAATATPAQAVPPAAASAAKGKRPASKPSKKKAAAGKAKAATTSPATGKQAERAPATTAAGTAAEGSATSDHEDEAAAGAEATAAEEGIVSGSDVVVLQPGSWKLVLGLASSSLPRSVPHAVARPWFGAEDDAMLGSVQRPEPAQLLTLREAALEDADTILRSQLTDKRKYRLRAVVNVSTLAAFNEQSQVERIPSHNDQMDRDWTEAPPRRKGARDAKPPKPQPVYVGEEALLVPLQGYRVHWPVHRGTIDRSVEEQGLMAVLNDLESIWRHSIEKSLQIKSKDFKNYRVLLVVPDTFRRAQLQHYMDVCLNRLGFKLAMVQQESVCATFGAGISFGCVVNVGHTATTVVCVEEGMALRKTRVLCPYGGVDIDEAFFWCLKKVGFPYKSCSLANRLDRLLLNSLKEQYCHLNFDSYQTQVVSFRVRRPLLTTEEYKVKFADQGIQAAMGLFFPGLFGFDAEAGHGKDLADKTILPEERIFEDMRPPDAASRSAAAHKPAAGTAAVPSEGTTAAPAAATTKTATVKRSKAPEEHKGQNVVIIRTTPDRKAAVVDKPKNGKPSKRRRLDPPAPDSEAASEGPAEPDRPSLHGCALDEAIVYSIMCNPESQTRKKMLGCVLLCGGASALPGLADVLQIRLGLQLPDALQPEADRMGILRRPKDLDPSYLSWKGGAITAQLDAAADCWISQRDWQLFGPRLLRERSPFVW